MSGPNWKLEDDLQTVTITFPSDPHVVLKLGAEQIDDLLRGVGELRAYMTPAVEERWALGQKFPAIPDPAYATEPDALMGASVIHLRDPRFGWLHYVLPKHEAQKLGSHLVAQSELPPPGSERGQSN